MTPAENTAMGAPDQGDWLTVAEFAAKLRIEPATVYAAIQDGTIDGVIRVGTRRGYRIPRASYDAFVEARRVNLAAPQPAPVVAAA